MTGVQTCALPIWEGKLFINRGGHHEYAHGTISRQFEELGWQKIRACFPVKLEADSFYGLYDGCVPYNICFSLKFKLCLKVNYMFEKVE